MAQSLNVPPEGKNYWEDEDPEFSVWDWVQKVAQRVTRLGYWEWVKAQRAYAFVEGEDFI